MKTNTTKLKTKGFFHLVFSFGSLLQHYQPTKTIVSMIKIHRTQILAMVVDYILTTYEILQKGKLEEDGINNLFSLFSKKQITEIEHNKYTNFMAEARREEKGNELK